MNTFIITKKPWWIWHGVLPTVLFVALACIGEFTSLDMVINNVFYDFTEKRWFFADSWWSNKLIHKGGNLLVKITATGLGLLWLLGWWRPALKPYQRSALYALLVIGLSTGLVALGKNISNIHCPRELSHYGGTHDYIHLLDKRPAAPAGHCFPGGHSSGGFSFFFLYFLLHDKAAAVRNRALLFALLLGSVFAFGQWVRGAHFLSHDLWSAYIAWVVALGLSIKLLKPSTNPFTLSSPTVGS